MPGLFIGQPAEHGCHVRIGNLIPALSIGLLPIYLDTDRQIENIIQSKHLYFHYCPNVIEIKSTGYRQAPLESGCDLIGGPVK